MLDPMSQNSLELWLVHMYRCMSNSAECIQDIILSMVMEIGDLEEDPRSVEDEYTAYISQPLSPQRTDILKFWAVRRT